MSAPRTMSEIRLGDLGAEIDAAQAHDTERGMCAVAAELWDAVTAERAAFTALEQEYAQAVRTLDDVQWVLAFARANAAPMSNEREEITNAQSVCRRVLSTPRAQAVKEVE